MLLWLGFMLVAQDEEPLRAHAKLYKKVSSAIVGVRAGAQRGSGAIYHKDGWVVTSYTAVGATAEYADVYVQGHKKAVGRVVERRQDLELAVVKIDPRHVRAVLELGDSDQVRPGSLCYVLGDSYNSIFSDDQVAVSVGHVSGLYDLKTAKTSTFYKGPVIETNAAVNPNEDGGVMLDKAGRIIGMITLNYHEAKFAGVAIPAGRLAAVCRRWAASEVWAGFEAETAGERVVVKKIVEKGPAAEAGLQEGDVLVKVGQWEIRSPGDFAAAIRFHKPGEKVKIEVRRGEEKLDVTIVVEERDSF